MSNLPTVQAIYQAFGAGDGAGFLSHLADDVEWEQWADNQAVAAGVPWLQPYTGRDAVVGNVDGKVARLRHYIDTAKHIQAFRG